MLDSLPEPSELVEDEWGAMKIRFSREGLSWDKLGQDQRTLQVPPVYSQLLLALVSSSFSHLEHRSKLSCAGAAR